MNNYFLFFLLCINASLMQAQTIELIDGDTTYMYRYTSNSVAPTLKDSLPDGTYIVFSPKNNYLKKDLFALSNKGDSLIIASYKKGKRTGSFKEFYTHGGVHIISTYREGKLNGQFTEYRVNHSILLTGNYNDGFKDGTFKSYHKDDERIMLSNEKFKNGNLLNDWYDEKESTGYLKLNQFNSTVSRIEAEVKNNMINGRFRVWDSNGRIVVDGYYKNDSLWSFKNGYEYEKSDDTFKAGTWIYYFGQGYIKEVKYNNWYKNGQMSFEKTGSKETSWFESGIKKMEVNYSNKEHNSYAINYYDEKGKLIRTEKFDNGSMQSSQFF